MLRVDDVGSYAELDLEHAGDIDLIDSLLRQHWAHLEEHTLCMNWTMVTRLSTLVGMTEPVGEVVFPSATMAVLSDDTMKDGLVRIR